MKRILILVLALGLVSGSIATADAKKKAKPVKTTLYLHGTEMLGEVDMANNFGVGYNKMDTTAPDGPAPKSIGVSAWGGFPFNDCAGMFVLPVWTSPLSGQVKGDLKITLHSVSAPRSVQVQIWPDVMTQTCASNDVSNGTYPEPAVQTTVEMTPGLGVTEVVVKGVNFKALGSLMLQLRPEGPGAGRFLYDGADYASAIEFTCIPASGKSCV